MVINENWEKGMLGSILKGAESIKKPGFLVVPADMPFIPASLFRNLVTEAEQRQNRGESEAAIFAAHKGKLGHPVWIPAFFLAEMKKLPPDAKLREYLLTQPWVALEAGTEGIWIDIDNPRDYAKAEKLGRFHPP